MKRILLAVLLLNVTSAWAEWVLLDHSAGGGQFDVYIDPATIRQSGDMVKGWTLNDYKTEQVIKSNGKRYLSFKRQLEFNCKDESLRTLYYIVHYGQMGTGDIVDRIDGSDNKFRPIAPGTVSENLWNSACGKK